MNEETEFWPDDDTLKSAKERLTHMRTALKTAAFQYENKSLIEKIRAEFRTTYTDAQDLFEDLIKFLVLCNEHVGTTTLVPPPRIDEAWHLFILRTSEYREFCRTYLGKFIDHCPTEPRPSKKDSDTMRKWQMATIELAKNRFTLSHNWRVHLPRKRKRGGRQKAVASHNQPSHCYSCSS